MPWLRNQSDSFQKVLRSVCHVAANGYHSPCGNSSDRLQTNTVKCGCPVFWDKSVHKHHSIQKNQRSYRCVCSFHQFFLYLRQKDLRSSLLFLSCLGIPETSYVPVRNQVLPNPSGNPGAKGLPVFLPLPAVPADNGYNQVLARHDTVLRKPPDSASLPADLSADAGVHPDIKSNHHYR
ncbi:unknown [Clostridium sp. CAG:505]|nr:unknown [Clostridium sp. CAG:505]